MSHQSGIHSSDALKAAFAAAHNGNNTRLIKASINGENLDLDQTVPVAGAWDADYDATVLPLLSNDGGCYIFYRLDSKSTYGYQWILLCFTPDDAPVREKMLYASTRATLKREFGDQYVLNDIHATEKEEMSLNGYKAHLTHKAAAAPLSMKEVEAIEIAETEMRVDIGASTRHQTVAGISFPVEQSALDELRRLHSGNINHVQLKVDTANEIIQLSSSGSLEPPALSATYPENSPRYTVYAYTHNYEGLVQKAIVFVYMCPGYNCPVKERMLYSSCKADVLLVVEKEIGLPIDAKVESSDPVDINDEFLMDTVHPKDASMNIKPKFSRPKKAGRTARRPIAK